MGFWGRVLTFLTSKPKRARHKWDPITNPFDAKRVAGDLSLEADGQRLGAAGVPRELDTSLSGPESRAVLAVEQALTDYVESYQLRLKALKAQISRSDLSAKIADASASGDQFQRQAAGLLTENAADLKRLEEMARSRREGFERFRTVHRRVELPHYPQGIWKTLKVVLALTLIVLEAIFNAGFFAQGLSGGLVAGAVQAGAFSLINVLGSLLLSFGIVRYANHAQWPKRLGGFVGALVLVSGIVLLALYVSHYRDALVVSATDAGGLAQRTFLANPFGLAEPSSWLLFFLSVAFGVVAMWDGYSMDDPYPGYGRAHRRMVEAADQYNDAIGTLREQLEAYRQEMLERIDKAQQACESSIVDLKGALSDKLRLRDEMPNQIGSLHLALAALINTFRTANVVGRQGSATPAYFNSTPRLGSRELPNFSIETDADLLVKQEALATDFLQVQAEIRARIQSAFNDRYNSLLTVDDLFDPARQEVNQGDVSTAGTAHASNVKNLRASASPDATAVPRPSVVSDSGARG